MTALVAADRVDSSGRSGRRARSSRRPWWSTGSPTSARTTDGSSRCSPTAGRIVWAYQTGGRINASPTIVGESVCVTNYSGSFVCLDRKHGRGALDDVPQARSVPLRELLRERRRATGRGCTRSHAPGKVVGARRLGRARRLDGRGRRARLHDARGRRRPRLRRRLRRQASCVPRHDGGRALEQVGRRTDPGSARRHRAVRLLLDAREADVRAPRLRRLDRVAAPARPATRRESPPSGRTSSRSTAGSSPSAVATSRASR